MNSRPFPHTTPPSTGGSQLRLLRRQARLSQLDLALITGISQRHLSCIETGRARPGPGTLHNLLMALEVPLEQCNSVFLACGYAPRYEATPLSSPAMDAVRDAITHVLHANNPAPAIVLGSHWEVLAANAANVAEFRAGKEKAFNALVGQVMKAAKGKANPQQVNELLKKKLAG